MLEWTPEQKDKVINILKKKGIRLPCPRCGNPEFTLLDGYSLQLIQQELGRIVVGGPNVPLITTVCTQCGFVSQHALGALGLLPDKEVADA